MNEKLEWIVQTYLGMQPGDHQCVSWNQMQDKMVKEILELFDSQKISKLERVKPYYYAYQNVKTVSKDKYFQYFLIPSDSGNLKEDWYIFRMFLFPIEGTDAEVWSTEEALSIDLSEPIFTNITPDWKKIEMDRINLEKFQSLGMEIKGGVL